MAPDTNFKEQDPKKQYNTPENPKDRHGSYDKGQNFDPTEGYDNHPDDQYTADMVQEEDRFMAREGHQYKEDDEETGETEERPKEKGSKADNRG
ncbi:MAG: hypothetical protein WD273_06870 [Trueperaceae bacterium]